MKENKRGGFPDYVFETSWEVCNKVGGIYTVLSTRAKSLVSLLDERLVFIGPDFPQKKTADFKEEETPYSDWAKEVNKKKEVKVRCGRWEVPGRPIAILVDFTNFWKQKDASYFKMWQWYGIESDKGFGDYDESCVFALSVAYVIESIYSFFHLEKKKVVAHFNEWTVGMGLLHLKHTCPKIGTLFTTHATSIGRSIAFNEKELYKYFQGYHGDQMAQELNMVAKHALEKKAAWEADCFTTVSDITALECEQLLDKQPDIVTPNGFEADYLPEEKDFESKRKAAKTSVLKVLQSLTGEKVSEDALLVSIGGRCEYKNKGINVFIDALNHIRTQMSVEREIVGIIFVPAWSNDARGDLLSAMKQKKLSHQPLRDPYITHSLFNEGEDKILNHLRHSGFINSHKDKVKVLFVPVYLTGKDGIFNKGYYDLLIGMDVSIFPSYYEPWGYTPLESASFKVPTITTDKAGFGIFIKSLAPAKSLKEGVCVVARDDDNYWEVVKQIAEEVVGFTRLSKEVVETSRENAQKLSEKALWKHFIAYYKKAYLIALKKEK